MLARKSVVDLKVAVSSPGSATVVAKVVVLLIFPPDAAPSIPTTQVGANWESHPNCPPTIHPLTSRFAAENPPGKEDKMPTVSVKSFLPQPAPACTPA